MNFVTMCYYLGWYKKGDSFLTEKRWFQSIVISAKGTIGHNVGLLFIVYVIVGKLIISKHYYIIHNWIAPILDLMHIDKGNRGEKIA